MRGAGRHIAASRAVRRLPDALRNIIAIALRSPAFMPIGFGDHDEGVGFGLVI